MQLALLVLRERGRAIGEVERGRARWEVERGRAAWAPFLHSWPSEAPALPERAGLGWGFGGLGYGSLCVWEAVRAGAYCEKNETITLPEKNEWQEVNFVVWSK